jgi:hypothetical protein
MTHMTLPGTEIRLDPRRISKMEIFCAKATSIELRVFLMDVPSPRVVPFPDKAAAAEFYRKVWLLRCGEALDDQQIQRAITSPAV